MSQYDDLKRLAEAATPGPWSTESNELYWHEDGYTKHLMETFDGSDICHDAEHPANLKFIAAANPTAVLALIAENERLRDSHGQVCTNYNKVSYASEQRGKQINQLKAENGALLKLASELRGSAQCNNVHHTASELHELGAPCKVLARIDAAMSKESGQ